MQRLRYLTLLSLFLCAPIVCFPASQAHAADVWQWILWLFGVGGDSASQTQETSGSADENLPSLSGGLNLDESSPSDSDSQLEEIYSLPASTTYSSDLNLLPPEGSYYESSIYNSYSSDYGEEEMEVLENPDTIPEPATGLLVVIGAAAAAGGYALRRRSRASGR